jgi:hypothetical protein
MWPMAVAPDGSFYLHNQPMLDQFLINKNMVGLQTPSCLQFSAGEPCGKERLRTPLPRTCGPVDAASSLPCTSDDVDDDCDQ